MTSKYQILFESNLDLTKYQVENILDKLKLILYDDFTIILKNLKLSFLYRVKNDKN